MSSTRLRLVTFDALHTLITPRQPIYIQYAQAFEPFLGELDPVALKRSFKVSLKALQREYPAYAGYDGVSTSGRAEFKDPVERWWGEVIRRCAVGAGAQQNVVDQHLSSIVPALMKRFSSREGYKMFDDAIPALERLNEMGLRVAVISNSDSRIRSALKDLDLPPFVDPIILSEEFRIEKPDKRIFIHTLNTTSATLPQALRPEECLHVGDDLHDDYQGATEAGMNALLLRRPGEEYDSTAEEEVGVSYVQTLLDVPEFIAGNSDGNSS